MSKGYVDDSKFYNELIKIVGSDDVLKNEPMKRHTTFRIGGAADYFVMPHTIVEIREIISLCHDWNIDYYIMGNGSNLLVSDAGYRGVIIQLYHNFSEIIFDGCEVRAQSGCLLSKMGNECLKRQLKGFEFATGIPGCVGGAVVMNAGAYGGEIKDCIVSATFMDREGNVFTLPKEELQLGYRTSIAMEKEYIVLEASFNLERGNYEDIEARIKELRDARIAKQPLEYPSAGSTFKRPEGYFAGKLIQDTGLKGYRVGGACVSEKHSGFVINVENATAQDVITLTDNIRSRVHEKYGVWLELEVRKVGF